MMSRSSIPRLKLFWFFFLFFSQESLAVGASVIGCAKLAPTERPGSPSCWVRLRIQGEPLSLCLSRPLWQSWLLHPSSLCGTWDGNWSLYSPPENSDMPATSPKTIEHRFKVKTLPAGAPATTPLFLLWLGLEKLRERLSARLEDSQKSFPKSSPQNSNVSLGIFRKLLLNQNTPESPGNLLRFLGFVHLLTATGIHLYALAAFWDRIVLNLARWIGLPVRLGLPLARGCSGLTALLAWLLSGARLGMLRPFLILALRSLARSQGFQWRKWSPLGLSLFGDICVEAAQSWFSSPRRIAHFNGRLLYTLAVGGGLMSQSLPRGQQKKTSPGEEHLRLSLGSWVFVALWDGWKSQVIAPFTPLFSLISLPLFCSWVYPLLLSDSLFQLFIGHSPSFLITWATQPAEMALSLLTWLSWRGPTLWQVPRSALLGGGVLAALLLSIGTPKIKLKRAPLIALTAFILFCFFFRLSGELGPSLYFSEHNETHTVLTATQIEQLDIGQGDAALILDSRGGAGFIDAGPPLALGPEKWLEIFFQRGVLRLDWIALTHLDQDHAGGVLTLARLIPIRCVATARAELETDRGRNFKLSLEKLHVPVLAFEASPGLCVPFRVLTPPFRGGGHSTKANGNMSAILVPLQGGGFYFSPGDADQRDEIRMGNWIRKNVPDTAYPRILKVAHHGSRTSDSDFFYTALAPSEAWISAGIGNRYGHPSVQVLSSLRAKGVPLHRTDQEGRIRWVVGR